MQVTKRDARRHAVVALLAMSLAQACSAPAATPAPDSTLGAASPRTSGIAPTPSPGISAETPSSPGETTLPTTTVSASPPEPSATAAAADATGLEIDWASRPIAGIGPVEAILGVARAGDTYVLLASLPYWDEASPKSGLWWSTDGESWVLAADLPADVRLHAIVAGGPGFVATGGDEDGVSVWISEDGRDWQPVSDPSLRDGVITQLVVTRAGLVGFGWRSGDDAGAIWTSPDGFEWLAATNETGLTVARGLHAVGSYGGRAVAFVSEGDDRPSAIWETTGRADWTRVGALRDVAWISRVAGGPRGWVAIGENRAWGSSDGRRWSDGAPGPDVDADLLVGDAGMIAVGHVGSLPGETCGDQRPFAGHTWTSVDGASWMRMPVTKGFTTAMISKLLVVDQTVVGFGQLVDSGYGEMDVARWSAPFPDEAAPTGASDEASVPVSCGG